MPDSETNSGMVNVRDHGAIGDGQADDTLAIRAAMAAALKGGVVFFPPGHYRTDTIYVPSYLTLMGHPSWSYQESGHTVLSPVREHQARLIDANGKEAVRIVGLALDGLKLGAAMTGLFSGRASGHEQNLVVDNCRIAQFSGHGMELNEGHVWHIRRSMFIYNGLDGLDAHNSFDGWISDSLFTANGRCGLSLGNSTTVTGNRIEHNSQVGLTCDRYFGQHLQITGNLFCSDFGPAIELLPGNVRAIAITGNTFRNSARCSKATPERDCHVRLEGAQGIVFSHNVLHVLWCDNPACAIIIRDLQESVISGNTLYKGAASELIRDLGGHRDCVIENNPGSLKKPHDLDS